MEKKFIFNLEGLLNMRKFKEKKVKRELEEVRREIKELEDNKKILEKRIEQAYLNQEEMIKNRKNGELFKFYPRYINFNREEMRNKEVLIDSLKEKYNNKIKELENIRGEVKVVEKIKKKKFLEYTRKVENKEQEEVEDSIRMSSFFFKGTRP